MEAEDVIVSKPFKQRDYVTRRVFISPGAHLDDLITSWNDNAYAHLGIHIATAVADSARLPVATNLRFWVQMRETYES